MSPETEVSSNTLSALQASSVYQSRSYRAVVVGIDGRVLLPVARRAVFAHHKGDGVRFGVVAGGKREYADSTQHHERQNDQNSVLDFCHKNYSFYKIYFLAK